MANNFTNSDIVQRIYLTLPSRFDKTDQTDLYHMFYGIADALRFNSEYIDELYAQTNLVSATGAYVDDYIGGLTKIGRKEDEADEDYKARYWNQTFKYNCTKAGLSAISIDLMGKEPYQMYTDKVNGAFWDSEYYYDDEPFYSIYGSEDDEPFTGYIEFGREPDAERLNDLCDVIEKCRASGVTIYIVYPSYNDLTSLSFSDGTFERSELVA
jgi:hypothetical protein